jgi:hypothetical protein
MARRYSLISGALLSTLMAFPLPADTLRIGVSAQGQQYDNLPRPVRGMSQSSVENRWGKPQSVRGPIGNPPITRWEYPHFQVVFESGAVIHTVLKPGPTERLPNPKTPQEALEEPPMELFE